MKDKRRSAAKAGVVCRGGEGPASSFFFPQASEGPRMRYIRSWGAQVRQGDFLRLREDSAPAERSVSIAKRK